MNTAAREPAFVLRGCEAKHLFLINDQTLLDLLPRLLVDDAAVRCRQLLELGQHDAAWAAWLLDLVTEGHRRGIAGDTNSADNVDQSVAAGRGFPAEPPFWTLIESRLKQLINAPDFERRIHESIGELVLTDSSYHEWSQHDQAIQSEAARVCLHRHDLQRRDGVDDFSERRRAAAFYWWACYLGVAVWDNERQQQHTGMWRCPFAAEQAEGTSTSSDTGGSIRRLGRSVIERCQRLREFEADFAAKLEREKLLAMKELAYGASHEINNPLANISSRAQIMLRDETDVKRRKALASINRQAFRAHEMIADMMLFAKPPALAIVETCWDEWVDSLSCGLADECPDEVTLTIDHQEAEDAAIWFDATQMEVAVRAIFKNAVEVCGDSGSVRLRTRLEYAHNGAVRFATIEIEDDGPGISDKVRRHLFDPFFSGREAGRGLGFGLSKAWRIADLHEGQVLVESQAGRTSMTLRFPVGKPVEPTSSTAAKTSDTVSS